MARDPEGYGATRDRIAAEARLRAELEEQGEAFLDEMATTLRDSFAGMVADAVAADADERRELERLVQTLPASDLERYRLAAKRDGDGVRGSLRLVRPGDRLQNGERYLPEGLGEMREGYLSTLAEKRGEVEHVRRKAQLRREIQEAQAAGAEFEVSRLQAQLHQLETEGYRPPWADVSLEAKADALPMVLGTIPDGSYTGEQVRLLQDVVKASEKRPELLQRTRLVRAVVPGPDGEPAVTYSVWSWSPDAPEAPPKAGQGFYLAGTRTVALSEVVERHAMVAAQAVAQFGQVLGEDAVRGSMFHGPFGPEQMVPEPGDVQG